jgi:hypothetical protein
MSLGASRLKRVALVLVVFILASVSFLSCGYNSSTSYSSSGGQTRVLASQSVASPTAFPGLVEINGTYDTLVRAAEISAGSAPGLMTLTPNRATLLAFDSSDNTVEIVSTQKPSLSGTIPLPGPTTSMVATSSSTAYAAVPSAPMIGPGSPPPGALIAMNVASGGVSATISVPGAQTVVSSSDGSQLLVFSSDSNSVTIVSPLLVNIGTPTMLIPGFDRPVYGVFSADGTAAYILNCGAQCGGTQASVQVLDFTTTPPSSGAVVPVNGATIGFMSGSTLYVAGRGTETGTLCASITSAAPTAAQYCGTLDAVNLTTMQDPYFNNPAMEIAIPDGYHNRIDMSTNGQLFVGSYGCTTVGNVNSPQGEVRGCLAIYNTNTGATVIPPDNGDVTGLQSFTSRDVEYVAEGGNLRVYDTRIDSLLMNTYIESGTITIGGKVIDVKAIDFF